MTDRIKDAILALQNGESSQFKDVINQELINRAMDSIQLQKINAGQAFFDQPASDSIDLELEEQPDEEI